MMMLQVNPDAVTLDVMAKVKSDLIKWFQESDVHLDSLYFQESKDVFNGFREETPSELLMGSAHVHENLMDLTFRVSPTAFFQVNTTATIDLYSSLKEWFQNSEKKVSEDEASKDKKIVLLDLCCGTGTIGLAMARHVKKVIGVEMIKEAIEDAEHNASLNGTFSFSSSFQEFPMSCICIAKWKKQWKRFSKSMSLKKMMLLPF